MMSFGSPMVSGIGPTYSVPTLSMLSGMIGNAMGLSHKDTDDLNALQADIVYGARADQAGEPLDDYQTIDLGQDFLVSPGWTTWGTREARAGGNSDGTHIRSRAYWTNACFLIALRIRGSVSETDVSAALKRPARPLFIGRKCCLPSARIFLSANDESIWDNLTSYPPLQSAPNAALTAWGPVDGAPADHQLEVLRDQRDWAFGVHAGTRQIARAQVRPPLQRSER